MADINERVKEQWKEETTGRERVKEVLEETTIYNSASAIASKALVSEPTTRKYLNEFAQEGLAVTTQNGRTTEYKRDEGRVITDRIEELRTTHTHAELIEGIRDMSNDVRNFRQKHDVDSVEDLATTLEPGDDGWGDVDQWRSTRKNLALAKAALQVDEAHRVAEV